MAILKFIEAVRDDFLLHDFGTQFTVLIVATLIGMIVVHKSR